MDYKKLRDPLSIKDIDFRVQSINKGGYATILAYKDARVDMNRLDDVLGIENWQRDVKFINGTLYGGVGIYNEKLNEWVWKWDAGTESAAEAKKGESSDAFKRACFNLGIGRELYNYPVISIKLNDKEVQDKAGKKYASWEFKLKEWKWLSQFTDGELTFLAAQDNHGKTRFNWGTFDKNRNVEEYDKASGAPEPQPIEEVNNTGGTEASDANVEGVLKKKGEIAEKVAVSPTPEPVELSLEQEEWNDLAERHKVHFGKMPSSKMKLQTLKDKIHEADEYEGEQKALRDEEDKAKAVKPDERVSRASTVDEVPLKEKTAIEEDLGMYAGVMKDDAIKIESFTDKADFKVWAVEMAKKWLDKAPDDHIEEFKAKCRVHFEKIG